MAIVHNWQSEYLLHVQYKGRVTGKEVLSSIVEYSRDPRYRDLRFIIGDWSEYSASDGQLDVTDIEKAAALINSMVKTNPYIRVATVLMGKHIENRGAFARLFESFTQGILWDVASFDTLDEAKAWLGPID